MRAEALVKFLDAYTYEGYDPLTGRPEKRINGRRITPNHQRGIRRWRHGHVQHVNRQHAEEVLVGFDFTWTWFVKWCRLYNVQVAD